MRKEYLLLLTCLTISAGCNPAEKSADDQPSKPTQVAFVGKTDPKFVGSWSAVKGGSGLNLSKDGTAEIITLTPTPKGMVHGKLPGNWLTNDGNLLLRYSTGKGSETTIKYKTEIAGDTLTLITAAARLKTVYKRK